MSKQVAHHCVKSMNPGQVGGIVHSGTCLYDIVSIEVPNLQVPLV